MEKKLVFFLLTLGFIIFSILSVDSTSVLTLATDTKDAPVVSGNPNTNYASSALQIGNISSQTIRSYLFFDLNNLYSKGDIVFISANLSIINYSLRQDKTLNASIHVLYNNWINSTGSNILAENKLTWNNQPCGKNFDNFTNCNLTEEARVKPASNWNLYFDISNSILNAYNNNNKNISYVLKATNGSVTKSNAYSPREISTWAPRITVNYDPYILVISPTSGQVFSQDSPTAYLNISTLVNMSDCYWSPDSGANNYSMSKVNDTYFYNDTVGEGVFSDGSNSATFYCNQSSDGTWRRSETIIFETDPINITKCRNLYTDREYKISNNISFDIANGHCIYASSGPQNITIDGQGHELSMSGYDDWSMGIYIRYAEEVIIKNLILSVNITYSSYSNSLIMVQGPSSFFKCYNISGYSFNGDKSSTYAIWSYDSPFTDISNITFENFNASAVIWSYYSSSINVTNVNLIGTTYSGNWIFTESGSYAPSLGKNSYIKDSYINVTGGAIYTDGSLILLNVTGIEDTTKINVSDGNLTKKWYLDYQVNSSSWGLLENANVTVVNKSGLSVSSYLTNSSGSISRQEISEYFNDNGTITYYTPHNITVSKEGYTTNITTYNLTLLENINKFITLNDFVPPSLNATYPIEGSSVPNVVNYYTMEVNFTVNEIHPGYCWYNISGAKTVGNTIIPCSNETNSFTITFTEFGLMHLYISSNDTENNLGYTDINFSILKYTGAESGGPNDVGPVTTTNYSLNLTKAQRTVLCSRINVSFANYSTDYSKYPSSVRDSIRNDLAIALGRGISNSILKYYIENFNTECPEYVKKYLSVIPEEETQEPVNYTAIFVIIGIALVIIGFILFDRVILHSTIISKKRRDQLYGRKD